MALDLKKINNDWTLFLDRDGVINYEKEEDYIYTSEEFRFYEKTPEAVGLLSMKFDRIFVVTNQKGVGKGLMTENDLQAIHRKLLSGIEQAGGRIQRIYYCTGTDNNDPDRKPNPGMAYKAKKDFPQILFDKSIMAGNKMSDMLFGRNAGMHTVFLATTHPETPFPHPDIDARFGSLIEFANAL